MNGKSLSNTPSDVGRNRSRTIVCSARNLVEKKNYYSFIEVLFNKWYFSFRFIIAIMNWKVFSYFEKHFHPEYVTIARAPALANNRIKVNENFATWCTGMFLRICCTKFIFILFLIRCFFFVMLISMAVIAELSKFSNQFNFIHYGYKKITELGIKRQQKRIVFTYLLGDMKMCHIGCDHLMQLLIMFWMNYYTIILYYSVLSFYWFSIT